MAAARRSGSSAPRTPPGLQRLVAAVGCSSGCCSPVQMQVGRQRPARTMRGQRDQPRARTSSCRRRAACSRCRNPSRSSPSKSRLSRLAHLLLPVAAHSMSQRSADLGRGRCWGLRVDEAPQPLGMHAVADAGHAATLRAPWPTPKSSLPRSPCQNAPVKLEHHAGHPAERAARVVKPRPRRQPPLTGQLCGRQLGGGVEGFEVR